MLLNVSGNPLTPTALVQQAEPLLDSEDVTNSGIFLPFVMR